MVCRILAPLLGVTLAVTMLFGQNTDEPKVASPATDAQLKALAESEAYEYSIVIREKKTNTFEEIAAPRLISRKGSESFAGLPHGDGKKVDSSLPSRVYCRAKVEDVKDGVAQLRITVGQSLELTQKDNDTSWTEHKRSVRRDVRLGNTVSVQLPASTSIDSSAFEFSIKVELFVPTLSAR